VPKIGRTTGASDADGSVGVVDQRGGVDLILTGVGADLHVGERLS